MNSHRDDRLSRFHVQKHLLFFTWPRRFLAFLIRMYQRFISPYLPARCRYYPTCSDYVRHAVLTYGMFKGGFIGLKRILRCHPWHEGGYDPLR